MGADNGGSVPQDALDHDQVASGLHNAAGLYHPGHLNIAHGPDGKAAENVAANVHIA